MTGIAAQAIGKVKRERARVLISAELGVELARVTDEASFVDDLGADSLDKVELALAIEDAFGVKLDDAAIETFVIVNDLLRWLEANAP